jgi:hypothetical protein
MQSRQERAPAKWVQQSRQERAPAKWVQQSRQERAPAKWVGFDMDECVGDFTGLLYYCDELLMHRPPNTVRKILVEMAKTIFEHRIELNIFRPGLESLLRNIYRAYTNGKIAGAFILSNNGSNNLVQIVRMVMNMMAHETVKGSEPAQDLIKTACHRLHPARKIHPNSNSFPKTLQQIRDCIGNQELGPNDILFYDDQPHILANEIKNYIRVPEFNSPANMDAVKKYLEPIIFANLPLSARATAAIKNKTGPQILRDYEHEVAIQSPPNIDVFVTGWKKFMRRNRNETRRVNKHRSRVSKSLRLL